MKVIKTSFNAGELSEYMAGREDHKKYYNGCSVLVNATVLPYGGAVKRSGTEFIARAKGACKLFKLEYSADDSMIIEAGNTYMRFYKNGDRVMDAVKAIAGITLTGTDPVSVHVNTHGYSDNDVVRFGTTTEVVGIATELNYSSAKKNEYLVDVTDSNNFTLKNMDGTATDSSKFTAGAFSAGDVASAHEITTPYSATEIFDVHVTASADVIYLAHPDYAPRKLSRVADNNWTIETIVFDPPPFLTENTNSDSLMQFARTGGTAYPEGTHYQLAGATGTLTASDADGGSNNAPFVADHVGSYWLIKHTRGDNEQVMANGSLTTGTTDGIRIKGDFSLDASDFTTGDILILERKQGNGSWQTYRKFTAAVAYSSTEEDDDVFYRISTSSTSIESTLTAKNQMNSGIVRIDSISSPTVANVTVIDPVYCGSNGTSATTSIWAEGAWSDYRGFPKAVTFYEDRLWWAGTIYKPQTLWGSRSGDYEDHTNGVVDDDAVSLAINDNDASAIQWIAARKVLIAGTSNKEYAISGKSFDDPITPSAAKAKPQSSFGSGNLQPVVLNDGLFYSQRQGRKMRVMNLNEYGDQFKSDDATLLANHIFEQSPVDMDTQRTPDSIVWVVREDGTLCLFTYEPTEEVAAWSRIVTGTMSNGLLNGTSSPDHQFKSVKIISGDIEDEVWVVVARSIGDSTVYYIERFATRYIDQIDEALMLDSAKTVSSNYASQSIVLASDTVRYGAGTYGSSYYGGTK